MSPLETTLRTRPETVRSLLYRVGDRFGVTPDEILGTERLRHIVQARQVAAWILRRRGLSLPAIGKALHRDHTTISSSVRKIDQQIDSAPTLAALLDELLNPPEVP